MISSAGAGGGSFNHRFAMPGSGRQLRACRSCGRSTCRRSRTTGCSRRRAAARVTPKIFYTFSSTEYWARAGSLTHTSDDGRADVPLAATSRLYFLAGTPHSSGRLPLAKGRDQTFQHFINFAEQRWVTRALLLDLDAWARNESEPPASQYPSIAKGELVPLEDVHFPEGAVVPVRDLYAASVADGLRARLRHDESDHERAAAAGRAVSRAGASGERGRQRRVGHPAARSGGAAGHLHRMERHRPAIERAADISAAWSADSSRFRSRRSSGSERRRAALDCRALQRAARTISTGSNAPPTISSANGSCGSKTCRRCCRQPSGCGTPSFSRIVPS